MADVKYLITADAKGAVSGIKKTDTAIKGMKDQAKKAQSPIKGMWKQMALGTAVVAGVRGALRSLKKLMKGSLEASKEQELADKNLAVAIESTGRSYKDLFPHLKAYASELQSQTVYGDEAIEGAQALLIQLTKLDQDGLDAATRGAIGMASVFKTDLTSSTNLVAKALAGNFGALSRYGIKVDENLSLGEKQAQLLEKLNVFYIRAQGEVDTYSGATKQLSNTWGDLQEVLGDSITQNETFREGITELSGKIKTLSESDDFKLWLDIIINGFIKGLELIGKFGGAVKDLTEKVFALGKKDKELIEAQDKLNESLKRAKEAGHDLGEKYKVVVEESIKLEPKIKAVDDIQTTLNKTIDTAIQNISGVMVKTSDWGAEVLSLETILNNTQDELEGWSNAVVGVGRDMSDIVEQALPELEREAFETTVAVKSDWDDMADGLQTKWATTIGDVLMGATSLKDGLKGIWDAVLTQFTDMIGQMVAKWMTDFIGKVLEGSASAGASIAKNIGDSLSGAGADSVTSGIKVAAKSVSAVVDTISGVITAVATVAALFKKSGPSSTDSWHFEHIWKSVKETRDWHFINHQARLDEIAKVLTGVIPPRMKTTNDLLRKSLTALKSINKNLDDIPGGASGLDFQSGSSGGLVRYHPNERIVVSPNVNVRPNVNIKSAPVYVHLDGREIARAVAKYMPTLSDQGRMKLHKRGLTDRR